MATLWGTPASNIFLDAHWRRPWNKRPWSPALRVADLQDFPEITNRPTVAHRAFSEVEYKIGNSAEDDCVVWTEG
jgi:hypothetical protein